MIEEAIITLADRQGSSRKAIWDFIERKNPGADYKQFLVRLKKVDPKVIVKAAKGLKWRLESSYKKKLLAALKKGKSPSTVKKVKKSSIRKSGKKAKKTVKKSKKSAKKQAKKQKKMTKRKSASKKGQKKVQQKKKTNRGKGSKAVQKKKQQKAKINNKKAKLNKAKNTKKKGGKKEKQQKVEDVPQQDQ
jgi:hypothetical protein